MSRDAAASEVLFHGHWFRGDRFQPAQPGIYQVRNSDWVHHHSKAKLSGNRRYWDGKTWLTEEGGYKSIFGTHETHEFRGMRRWVLVRRLNPQFADGGLANPYFVSSLGKRPLWSHLLAAAGTFATKADAELVARLYPRRQLTAVLP